MVWQGSIDIATDLNKEVVTSFPVDEALPQRKPGVYVLTAVSATGARNEWDSQATQWFVISDIGLSTYSGTDGLSVFARSLASAKQMAGIELTLLAKNNEVLGTSTTDADGRATFDAGLLRGTAAMTPAVITAKSGDDDYVFLDLTRAGFDLSDRGVTGRAAPGAIDVLTWTERGIYRAGETVHVSALARDSASIAIEKLPLTFIFMRPDGVEDRRVVSDGGLAGGYALDLPLQPNAMRGTWTVQIFTDPKGTAISEKQFQVDDFVPDRVEFDMASTAKQIEIDTPVPVTIDGRFLYGAPAAGLELEGEVGLKPTRETEDFKGYLFGLADEEATEDSRTTLEGLEPLDEDGKATFDVTLTDVPSTTQLLNANITVRVQEAGGRAVERSLTLPVKPAGAMIGIKPEFSGDLAENAVGKFHVIAIDESGAKQGKTGLTWKLLRVEQDYQWYRDGTAWKYEPVTSTKQVSNGTLDVTTDGGEIAISGRLGPLQARSGNRRYRRPGLQRRVRFRLVCHRKLDGNAGWPGGCARQAELRDRRHRQAARVAAFCRRSPGDDRLGKADRHEDRVHPGRGRARSIFRSPPISARAPMSRQRSIVRAMRRKAACRCAPSASNGWLWIPQSASSPSRSTCRKRRCHARR